MRELSDDEVFGSADVELSDEEVFGAPTQQPDAQFVTGRRGTARSGPRPFVAGEDNSAAVAEQARREAAVADPRRLDRKFESVLGRPGPVDQVQEGRRRAEIAARREESLSPLGQQKRDLALARVDEDILSKRAQKAAAKAAVPGRFEGAGTAGDLLISYGKAFPMAVGLVAGMANIPTGGALDAVSAWADRAGQAMDEAKSVEARASARELDSILQDKNTNPLTVLGFLASKPEYVAGAIVESMPSLLIGAGSGRGAVGAFNVAAGRAAPAALASNKAAVMAELSAMRAKVAQGGAAVGNIGMGAGSVFSDESLRGENLIDRYNAAATTALGYAVAGKLTGGGAEAALAGSGARGALKIAGRESGQEFGESLSESFGKAVGTGKPVDLNEAAKSAVVDSVAGFGLGGAVGALQSRGQMSVEDALIRALETGQTRPAPDIRAEDMPTRPFTPEEVALISSVEKASAQDEQIPIGEATELSTPRAPAASDLGIANVRQGALADIADQQLTTRAQGEQLDVLVPAAVPVPAVDVPDDQPGGSGAALGRVAADGGTGSVRTGLPEVAASSDADAPAGRGGADDAALSATTPDGNPTKTGQKPAEPPTAPRLQNRDRSDAAYIQQMQAIAKNPDPDRLGVDRNMATGAPIVLADTVPDAQLGRVDRVVTAGGRKFPVQYAVVEAADLLPSNGADGTANAGYADGLPGRARVVAGNGRAAGLQLAFTNGNATGYVAGITADAASHGVNPATLAGMKQPVLVRIMQPADVTANIGDESNVSGVADKSAREAARDDARRLDLATLDFNDDGTLTPAALDAFVSAMPASEQTALRDSSGAPTKQAQDRLMAAVFQTAYEDDALLAMYAQAIDPEARVVMAGLAAAAPQMMLLKDAGELDIRGVVSQAAQMAINAKRRGINMSDMAAQTDLDTAEGVAVVLRMFAANNRSAKRIGEKLRNVAQRAYDEHTKPSVDMFGDVPKAKRADILGELDDTRGSQNLELTGRGQPPAVVDGRQAGDAASREGADATQGAEPAAAQADQADLEPAPTAEPFKTNGTALAYAAQNGIAGKVKPVEVAGGWALVPKERAPSVATAEADQVALDKANTALVKAGWKTPAGKPWKIKTARNVPPIFKTVAAIIDAAFGVRVQAVTGAPGNGLQYLRGAFVDVGRVTDILTLIGVTGHEVKHWFDANDKDTGAKLDRAIEQHLKSGAVQAQMARENAGLVAGEAPMTEAGARLELLSDINGSLWVDPEFWGRLYDIDNSAFRKVLYQFMRAATKLIKVAQGSTFDLTAYVDNVAAVRDAAAQAMVERADNRRGKAGPKMLVKNARRGPSPLDQDIFAQPDEPAFNLTAPTKADVLAQQDAKTAEARDEAAAKRKQDEEQRRERERRDIADRARQDASAENFQLGQSAEESLSGQGGLFNSRANGEWRLFPDTMGGKGIPRADMPQVKVKKRPELLQFLAKFGIEATRETVAASSLKPTQAEYSVKKTESAKGIPTTSDDQLVLASADDFVIDGHHRWLARQEQGEPVKVLRFNRPADEVMATVWLFGDTRVSGDSSGAFTETTTRADLPPARRKKIDAAAETAREWVPAGEVEKAVALLMRFDSVPQADVPDADRQRLAAIFAPEIKRAEAVNDQFKADLTALAKSIGADVKTAPVKSLNRTVEKMFEDETVKGLTADATWVRDLVRGSIVVNSQAEVAVALAALQGSMNVVRVKDRFAEPTITGYSDILVNVKLPNGMQAEVQIHAPPMLAAKDLGHMLYEIGRAIKPGADAVRLRMAQEELYAAARKAFTSDSNSSSDARDPSLSTRPAGTSTPVMADTQAPLGSRTIGISSRLMSVDPGGRAFQSNISDSSAGTTGETSVPREDEYASVGDPLSGDYKQLEGRKLSLSVLIEDTGQKATFTVDAAQHLRSLDARLDVARRFAGCVGR